MVRDVYRGRFAPTPSGPLHFGSIVAAAASFLDARAHDGYWHMRIDDLDLPRIEPGAVDAILHSLDALGFEWNGPVVFQSSRRDAYHGALHRLRERGLVYPCACSRKEVAEAAAPGAEDPIYPGICRGGMPAGRAARALRASAHGALVHFDDRVLGAQARDVEQQSGDFVVYRADGVYAFHLAAAVDDAELGMTDVVRGADLLQSSACQIWLIEQLGLPVPRYAHLPVAVDAHGQKLSKQTHAPPIDPSRPVSVLVQALRFLGQQPPDALLSETVPGFWRWATEQWDVAHVPKASGLTVAE